MGPLASTESRSLKSSSVRLELGERPSLCSLAHAGSNSGELAGEVKIQFDIFFQLEMLVFLKGERYESVAGLHSKAQSGIDGS